jgi:uncharacterized protein
MRDGIQLAASLFWPDPASHPSPWPALVEALPYRKDDLTAASHLDDYTQLANAGFVVCRVDLRGTGSSHGRATDEYPLSELDDLNDVVEWLAACDWSNGRVGMFGYSYSGFNSLQAACTRPPALGAVCAVYSTDDRYTDDVHYMGGSLRALDLVDYCHYMTATNALPPVPAVFGDGWFDEWLARIDEHEPWMLRWLREQTDGPYWRHGSLRPRYERIGCPTMLVGGWADGYRNNTLRTFAALRCEKELLVGPWSHMSPSSSLPGPHLDLGVEMIRFFGRWLRDDVTEPVAPIRAFVREATPPEPDLALHRGRWIEADDWQTTTRTLTPVLRQGRDGSMWGETGVDRLAVRPDVGTAAWNSCAGGLPWGQALDQRGDDGWSLTYDWPVTESLMILGSPRLRLRVAANVAVASVSAKLCNIAPDGTSQLITRGFLNLTHRSSSTHPQPLVVDQFTEVEIELEAAAWQFAPGHQIRLAIAGSDWPNTWVPPEAVVLSVSRPSIELDLPVEASLIHWAWAADSPLVDTVHGTALSDASPDAKPSAAEQSAAKQSAPQEAAQTTSADEPAPHWAVSHDVLRRITTCTSSYGSTGTLPDGGNYREQYDGEVGMPIRQQSAAWASGETQYELNWPGDECHVAAEFRVESDVEAFNVTIGLTATHNGSVVRRRSWNERIPRVLG